MTTGTVQKLEGDAEILLEVLVSIISSTTTDPLYHISEIVQNELDANASRIAVTFYRKGKSRSGKLEKIVIDGNGFGFLESFEHYIKNIGDSVKKYSEEYIRRRDRGLSRGQFCIGLQGFRAVCDELHVVAKTEEGMSPKIVKGKQIRDPDFSKMFNCRKMILKSNTLDATILEEGDFSDARGSSGVTCILINPKMAMRSSSLVKYLSQNKRTELLANKDLKIAVNDGSFSEQVKPTQFKGECVEYSMRHPKEKRSPKYRALGEVRATLYFHESKPGSKIRLDVEGEPIHFDITSLEEFDKPPWNLDFVEGVIEYDQLEKSPLRSGIERDSTFWPAFLDISDELAKNVRKKVKEYEEKSRDKRDEELLRKLEKVMGEVKRELDFQTWFDRPIEKPKPGPLDRIKVFPEILNVPVFTTRRVHVRAYDIEENALRERDGIKFAWVIKNGLGTVVSKSGGEAIFKAGPQIGATSLEASVYDSKTDKNLVAGIEIAITHPQRYGKLARVRIEPMFSKLAIDTEKEYRAVAEDEDRNQILKGAKFQWEITYDETIGASLNVDYGESVILSPGRNLGTVKLQVTAYQNGLRATDFAMITVVKKKKRRKKGPKLKDLGLPIPDWYDEPNEWPLRHSYLSTDGTRLNVNEGHPDYKNANATGKKPRQRYIASLYSKELAQKECEATGSTDIGEKMLDVLSKVERFW